MKTYIINFTNGSRIRITGDPVEATQQDDSVVAIHNGTDVYNIQRENVLYWSVSDEDSQTTTVDDVGNTSDSLTKRQNNILDGMSRGKTNKAIAYELGYSESTIRQESMVIYRMLGVSGREEAAEVTRLDKPVQVR